MEQHFRAAAHLLATRAATRSVFDDLESVRRYVESRERLALLVDFDGTLAPIADRPDEVRFPPLARALLARLARRPRSHVAVISGRGMDDLKAHIGLQDIVYVGNHGLEITGPGWAAERKDAAEIRELITACSSRVRERLQGVRGAIVEAKGLTASVHYRLVKRDQIEFVRQAVLDAVAQSPPGRVEVRRGKMVIELLPAIDWDKGRAALWLLEHLVGPRWRDQCAVIYAGDDRTDEDAFLALRETGITIEVGLNPQTTAAAYMVRSAGEFISLLQRILSWIPPAIAVPAVQRRWAAPV
jgi:trehalose 6-phosphate phosphatase